MSRQRRHLLLISRCCGRLFDELLYNKNLDVLLNMFLRIEVCGLFFLDFFQRISFFALNHILGFRSHLRLTQDILLRSEMGDVCYQF